MVQFDAEFHFVQHGTTTTLYDALTHLPWPYLVSNFGTEPTTFGANYSTLALVSYSCITSILPAYF
jgi:hypothetical protein